MPATITLNIRMTYCCRIHTDVELDVFQPTNGVCSVVPCIKCVQEKDALHNQIVSLQNEFNKNQHNKLGQIKRKLKKKPSLYLNGRKINFVTKKGGKK